MIPVNNATFFMIKILLFFLKLVLKIRTVRPEKMRSLLCNVSRLLLLLIIIIIIIVIIRIIRKKNLENHGTGTEIET